MTLKVINRKEATDNSSVEHSLWQKFKENNKGLLYLYILLFVYVHYLK